MGTNSYRKRKRKGWSPAVNTLENLALAKAKLLRQKHNLVQCDEKHDNLALKLLKKKQNQPKTVYSTNHVDPRLVIKENNVIRPKRMEFEFVMDSRDVVDPEPASLDPIPEVEWWDVPILKYGCYDGVVVDGETVDDKLRMNKITRYVEHPESCAEPFSPLRTPQPLKLTSKELKKLRTQRRIAREKDKQELIRQGLVEAPKGKSKMSNVYKMPGGEAVQEPTRLDRQIRAAEAERVQAHVDRNNARKLTPDERAAKKEKKLFAEGNNRLEIIVSVYKISQVLLPQNRLKMDINAQQNRLAGCAVLTKDFTVVVVEGGSKSIKRYGKLMLRRLNWSANEDGDLERTPNNNKCVLVWQGGVAKPTFDKFSVHECPSELAARNVFADVGAAHYWDVALSFSNDQV